MMHSPLLGGDLEPTTVDDNQDAQKDAYHYEYRWGERLRLMREAIEDGESNPLRVMHRMQQMERQHGKMGIFTGGEIRYVEPMDASQVDYAAAKPTGKVLAKLIPYGGKYSLGPTYQGIVPFMLDFLLFNECDALVEFGCGYGSNLFDIYYRGGPGSIHYIGAEYTQSGVEAGRQLCALAPDLPFSFHSFDFNAPDLSFLPKVKRLIAFSNHAIEQVPMIKPDFFTALARAADHVTCIHAEPFGFQYMADGGEASKKQEHFCKTHHFNMNLAPTLSALHQSKQINVLCMIKDTLGGAIENPTSLAIWNNDVT